MVKTGLQFRSGRKHACVEVQKMGVEVGVQRAGTGPFGKSQCKLMVDNCGRNIVRGAST
jgi:hypothetical protein